MGYTKAWLERPESFSKLTNEDFPDFEPEFIWELEKKAFLTDVVSTSNMPANGFLINQKVKDILSHFNIMEHKIYPATLIVNGDRLEYFWLHFKDCEEKYLGGIDYGKSTFSITNLVYRKIQDINLESRDDFWKEKMNLPLKHIRADKISLTNELKKEEKDLFYIAYIHSDYFVSERLLELLKTYKVTGLEIKEQSIL